MKKTNLIVRFSIFSKDENALLDINKIVSVLPEGNEIELMGMNRVLLNGIVKEKKNETTSIDYVYNYNVFEIEKINKDWVDLWAKYFETFMYLKEKYNFNFHLNYEITILDNNFPSFYYSIDFMKLLSSNNIELSMYFYSD